jgi:hypothetical protein
MSRVEQFYGLQGREQSVQLTIMEQKLPGERGLFCRIEPPGSRFDPGRRARRAVAHKLIVNTSFRLGYHGRLEDQTISRIDSPGYG